MAAIDREANSEQQERPRRHLLLASAALISSSAREPPWRELPVVDLPRRLLCAECKRHGTTTV
jgi:hypothetical protein